LFGIYCSPHLQHIDAVDISDNMLAIGREKAREAGIENVTFSLGTLTEFNADTARYDVILGLNVIHLLPDRQAVIGISWLCLTLAFMYTSN
jgi:ubiquinone/menaquinone biosynthesis C-methylase UbiE